MHLMHIAGPVDEDCLGPLHVRKDDVMELSHLGVNGTFLEQRFGVHGSDTENATRRFEVLQDSLPVLHTAWVAATQRQEDSYVVPLVDQLGEGGAAAQDLVVWMGDHGYGSHDGLRSQRFIVRTSPGVRFRSLIARARKDLVESPDELLVEVDAHGAHRTLDLARRAGADDR